MNTMRCPKCGRELFNLIDDSDFIYHFWCPECLIDINIEENCPRYFLYMMQIPWEF